MKPLKTSHVVLVLIIAWLIVIAPYVIPALNVTTRFLGIPITVWLAIIAFLLCLIVNAVAVRTTWETFDESEEKKEV